MNPAAIAAAAELLPMLKDLIGKIIPDSKPEDKPDDKASPEPNVALTGSVQTRSVTPVTPLQAIEILALHMPKDDKDKEDYIAAINMIMKGIAVLQKVGPPVAIPAWINPSPQAP